MSLGIIFSLGLVMSAEEAPESASIYSDQSSLEFEGVQVEGLVSLPADFFDFTNEREDNRSLLQEHLDFQFKDYNPLGF